MDTNDNRAKPSTTPAAAEPGVQPQHASPKDAAKALLEEILALEQSGGDPSRLRSLQIKYDAERVRQIDELLALDHDQAMLRVLKIRKTCFDILERVNETLKRPDLTRTEMMSFGKLQQAYSEVVCKTLVTEKELIERKRRP